MCLQGYNLHTDQHAALHINIVPNIRAVPSLSISLPLCVCAAAFQL